MEKERFDVIIAEDDEQISYLLNFMLAREKFTVKIANNGQEAIDIIDTVEKPKLIMLDIMMPHYNGFQILEHIQTKADWQDIPILMLTAKSKESDIAKALDAGATDYVVKPFQPAELITRLKRLMSK